LKFSLFVCMAWHRTFDAVSISYIRSSIFGSRPESTSFWQSMTSWHIMSFLLTFYSCLWYDLYESSISLIELLDFKISQLDVPQFRFFRF
jgi:hypothetical protein